MKRIGPELHFDVTNTGSCIPLRRLPQIFRPGYTTKYDSDGRASSGVGLTYIKALAEYLGGGITAASDGKNNVTFHVHLPLQRITSAQKKEQVSTVLSPIPQKKGPLS